MLNRRKMMLGQPFSKDKVLYWHYKMGTPADCGWTEMASDGSAGYGEMQENGYLLTAVGATYSAYMIIPPVPVWDGSGEIEAILTLDFNRDGDSISVGFADGSSGCFCTMIYNIGVIQVVHYEGTSQNRYNSGLSKGAKVKVRAVVENGQQSVYIDDIQIIANRPLSTRSATKIRVFPQNGNVATWPATVLVESVKVTLREE